MASLHIIAGFNIGNVVVDDDNRSDIIDICDYHISLNIQFQDLIFDTEQAILYKYLRKFRDRFSEV